MKNSSKSTRATSLFFITALSLFFVVVGCTAPTAEQQQKDAFAGTASTETGVLQADETLHRRLQEVLEADDAFTQLAGNATTETLDEKSGQIIQAEIALQKTIDSLEQHAKTAEESNTELTSRIAYFKAALQNRRAISDMRMVISANSDDSVTARQTRAQLEKQLQEKNKTIATLERAVQARGAKQPTPGNLVYDNGKNGYAPAKSESMADLRQRNKNLSLALGSLQTKYFLVGRDYLVLKKEHERTVNELAALRKSGNRK